MQELVNILRYRFVWLNIVLALFGIIISFYFYKAAAITFILISNLFDILGYHFTLVRRTTQPPEKIIILAYRIIQFLFDLLLLLVIGFLFDWIVALSGWIMKIFGLQDVLYYFFLRMKLPEKWTWMKWTPLGFFRGDLSRIEIVSQTLIGAVIAALLIILR